MSSRVRVDVDGLLPVEVVFLRSILAALKEPEDGPTRERLRCGELTVAIVNDDVEFMDLLQVKRMQESIEWLRRTGWLELIVDIEKWAHRMRKGVVE